MNPLAAVLDIGGKLIDKLFPDPAKKAEATLKLMELQQSGDLAVIAGQLEIDKIEAASPSLFVSGWRPMVGWICACGLGTQFIIRPLFMWIAALVGHPTEFPVLDMGTMMELLAGMLGMAGLRSYEKKNGVAAK